MPTIIEIQKDSAEKLYDLLMIKRDNGDYKNKRLDEVIARTKSSMTKETIAWVEMQIESIEI